MELVKRGLLGTQLQPGLTSAQHEPFLEQILAQDSPNLG